MHPARAGMIRSRQWLSVMRRHAPRASGDDPGDPSGGHYQLSMHPARAGMIPPQSQLACETDDAPRASGDDPGQTLDETTQAGCTPRERG